VDLDVASFQCVLTGIVAVAEKDPVGILPSRLAEVFDLNQVIDDRGAMEAYLFNLTSLFAGSGFFRRLRVISWGR
jgi:hypothetical protein